MINFDEELEKFKPSKEIDKARDTAGESKTSVADLLAEVMKLAQKNVGRK